MARLIDHAHEELTPLDELRQRRAADIAAAAEVNDGSIEALATLYGMTVRDLIEWGASGLDPELQRQLLARRRAAVLKAGGIDRPGASSPGYRSADDPEWGAKRDAALERARASQPTKEH